MSRLSLLCAIAARAALGAADPAAAQSVDVWGDGGLAKQCSDAARDGLAGARYEKICTDSIDTELLVPLDRAGTYVNRGIIKMRDKRYDEAIKDFDTAIKYKSSLAEAYANRAAALVGERNFRASLPDFDNALLLGVNEPEKVYYNRAVAYEWLDDYKNAYLDYTKAVSIAPDWALPRQQLARFSVNHPIEALPVVPSPSAPPGPQS